MRNAFFSAALCSFIFSTYLHAQEVIVARETKPEAPKQAVPSSEQSPSESLAPEPAKPKSRQEKSGSAVPTLEQMRMAGARAAEGLENRPLPQSTREIAPAPVPTVAETPRPVKRECPVEQRSTSPMSKPRSNKLEEIGPIRPTLIESGREAASAPRCRIARTGSQQA